MSFKTKLTSRLAELGVELSENLWAYMRWLVQNNHEHRYSSSDELFLSYSVNGEVVSDIQFTVPDDLVRYWLGAEGFEATIVPLVRCGGDGSYLALWKADDGEDRYVFLGSEGECFVVAESNEAFITLLTMGYISIEGRLELDVTPGEQWADWHDTPFPDFSELREWVSDRFGITHPNTGAELLPYGLSDDPFVKFVGSVVRTD